MTSRRWFALLLGLTLVLPIAPWPASAADWMPLAVGTSWEYQGDLGAHQVQTITGTQTLHGRLVSARTYAGGPDAGLQNFWLLDGDGSVLLAGFFRSEGFGLVYEPPIRYLPVPPAVGPQPPMTVAGHDYLTDAVLWTTDLRFEVLVEANLVIPAGPFHAFGVGEVPAAGPGFAAGRAFALDGRTLPAAASAAAAAEASDWFSEGVGVVQFRSSELFQLVSVTGPTPVAHSSWARVKRLYR